MSEVEAFDWETLTATEAASETEQPAKEEDSPAEPAAATASERPRDPETGQFLPKETAEEQGERLLAGKYRSTEQLEQAYLEAQSLLGSLRNDQGELRAQLEQLTEAIAGQQQYQRPVQDFEQLLATDPQQATLYALTVGDQQAYERAKAEWNELAPGAPALWEQNLQMQQRLNELEAKVTGIAAPVVEQQNTRVVADVWRSLSQQIPDFENLQAARSEIAGELAASGYDWVTPALESGEKPKIEAALKSLTDLARARASGNLVDQARAAAVEHVAATEQAKREAIVGSASTSMSDAPAKTPGERLAESWREFDISALRDA